MVEKKGRDGKAASAAARGYSDLLEPLKAAATSVVAVARYHTPRSWRVRALLAACAASVSLLAWALWPCPGSSFQSVANSPACVGPPVMTEYLPDNAPPDVSPVYEAYSIFLTPPLDILIRLDEEVAYLAGLYNGTSHEPHVTLGFGGCFYGGRDAVIAKAKELAGLLPPLKLEFQKVMTKKYVPWHRWPGGVEIDWEPTAELKAAALLQADLFGIPELEYRPHTTLLYDFTPRSQADHAGDKVQLRLLDPSVASQYDLEPLPRLTWVADRLSVWYTPLRSKWVDGKDLRTVVNRWHQVEEFSFGGVPEAGLPDDLIRRL